MTSRGLMRRGATGTRYVARLLRKRKVVVRNESCCSKRKLSIKTKVVVQNESYRSRRKSSFETKVVVQNECCRSKRKLAFKPKVATGSERQVSRFLLEPHQLLHVFFDKKQLVFCRVTSLIRKRTILGLYRNLCLGSSGIPRGVGLVS